jgi:hypothetical protein
VSLHYDPTMTKVSGDLYRALCDALDVFTHCHVRSDDPDDRAQDLCGYVPKGGGDRCRRPFDSPEHMTPERLQRELDRH